MKITERLFVIQHQSLKIGLSKKEMLSVTTFYNTEWETGWILRQSCQESQGKI